LTTKKIQVTLEAPHSRIGNGALIHPADACALLGAGIAFVKSIVTALAIYHHSTKLIKRGDGKSAVAAAAYRSGEKIVDRRTGITHDYTKKVGVEKTEILIPIEVTGDNFWLLDRTQLWNKIEEVEKRYDAQLAREIDIAVPVELDRQQRIDLVREYIQTSYVDRGMVADICFHDFESNNPHAHVMLVMRDLSIDDKGAINFGNKNRAWNDRDLLMTHRREWAEIANQHLERAGFDARIDHRSNKERGIATVPQIHLGVHCAAMRSKGISTERGDTYDRINEVNVDIRQKLEDLYRAEANLEAAEAELTIAEQQQKEKIYQIALKAGENIASYRNNPIYHEALAWQADRANNSEISQIEIATLPSEVTTAEILKTGTVTAASQATVPKTDRDLDFDELMRDPQPQIEKWRPTLQQPTDRELLDQLEPLWEKYGTQTPLPQFGNYRIEFGESIDIYYCDRLAMQIDERGSHLVDDGHTLTQYERGLSNAIDRYHEELEVDGVIDLPGSDLERDRELEPEVMPYLDLDFSNSDPPDLDFSNPDPSERQRERERYRDFDRGR
jgi:hypothetical protein